MMLKLYIPYGVASHELYGHGDLKTLKRKQQLDDLYHNFSGLCHPARFDQT